jgi:putative glutamine amidotransferase
LKKHKLFVPDYLGYADPFLKIFDIAKDVYEADVVMFTGGADIDPAFYNEKKGPRTFTTPSRDVREKALFDESHRLGKPILGICRGAQLLCAMAGGKLAQHITGHTHHQHRILTNEGEDYIMSSLHHQMMLLDGTDHELIAWTEKLSQRYLDGDDKEIPGVDVEPEIVYFPKVKGLGIQGHPEHFKNPHSTLDYLHDLVQTRLL